MIHQYTRDWGRKNHYGFWVKAALTIFGVVWYCYEWWLLYVCKIVRNFGSTKNVHKTEMIKIFFLWCCNTTPFFHACLIVTIDKICTLMYEYDPYVYKMITNDYFEILKY